MHFFFVIAMLVALAIPTCGNNLPNEFFGKFSLDHSENFDEYLAARGVIWILRRLISLMSSDIVFTKTGEDSFNYDYLSPVKNIHIKNITFGRAIMVETVNQRLENVNVTATFTFRSGRAYVHQAPIQSKDHDMEGIYSYKIHGDTLVLSTQAGGVVTKRYFKRQ